MSHALRQPKLHYTLPHGIEYFDAFPSTISKLLTGLAQVMWVSISLIVELLAIRFMIAFLGANPANGFFQFIYSVSQPFITPFANMFGDFVQLGPNRFEGYTLIAIFTYALLGYLIAKLASRHHHNLHVES